jgi:hypothetical protein
MLSRRELFGSISGALSSPILLRRADAQVTSGLMRYRPEIEPLVAQIEQVPREKAVQFLVEQFRRGAPYRQLMAALFLAGVRNVNPRPPGFALHCVFIIHSAHLIGMEAPPDSRLLPLFYALDNFKAAQERDAKQAAGDFSMQTIRGSLPKPAAAAAELTTAMEAWDAGGAERAIVSLVRNRNPVETVDLLRRYGARDYRNIGHKGIYVANAVRTLDVIGWQHAEPVLRSLVLSLLDFGPEQEVNGYRFDNQCYAANLRTVKDSFPRLPGAWSAEDGDAAVTRSMLDVWRSSTPAEMCGDVAARLVKGSAAAGSVWDAVHLAAGELAMRCRRSAAIVGIHAVTSANALHQAYSASSAPESRFLLLLQAAGWMGQFRKWAQDREESLREVKITELEPVGGDAALSETLTEVFAGVPSKLDLSAGRVLHLARDVQARQAFFTQALRLTLSKADEVHYYKYLAALIEDVARVSPEWQPYLAATLVYYAKGSNDPESALMKRAREALRTLPV